jgi:hypothetical protein
MGLTGDGEDWDDDPEGRDSNSGADEVTAWAVVDAKALSAGGLADVLSPVLVPRNDPSKAGQS